MELVGKSARQYAALPFRRSPDLEILLVTSRETGRWVIPKGWPMKGASPSAAAGREAMEEAGVTGRMAKSPLGAYAYVKFLKSGLGMACKVKVFALEVLDQRADWPEKAQRVTRWFPAGEAAAAVHERSLARIIRKFAKTGGRERGKGKGGGS
ncbi:MAG: NUDIX hydrolase [Caulobacteraceae bacterium]|nr:NUDIX hydrolase [Caulobacteraceae bacterium]